jgi:hypothetical protein
VSAGAVQVAGHGLAVTLPHPWEARLYLRDAPPGDRDFSPDPGVNDLGSDLDNAGGRGGLLAALQRGVAHPAARGWPGELTHPVLHLANFSLPRGRGDFGTGAVEQMRSHHAFVSLFEYERGESGRALFATAGLPMPQAAEFSASALQRRLAGQGGWQRFFHQDGRAFCVYVVLGSLAQARAVVPEVRQVLGQVRIGARPQLGALL